MTAEAGLDSHHKDHVGDIEIFKRRLGVLARFDREAGLHSAALYLFKRFAGASVYAGILMKRDAIRAAVAQLFYIAVGA